MVHPSQQKQQSPARKPPACVTITRGGKSRVYRIRPWVTAVAAAGLSVFLTAYMAATAYLVYRDDLLGAALARQVAMQYEYEDRVAALRAELDRAASRHIVQTQGVEEQLAVLLERQDLIQRRQSALDHLAEKARDAGLDVPVDLARVLQPRPGMPPAATTGAGEALAYAPSGPRAEDVTSGTLIRPSAAGRSATLREELKPLLFQVETSLDKVQDHQGQMLDALADGARIEADKIESALAPVGISVKRAEQRAPQGGPFIPAPDMHFVERTALLSRTLDEIAGLRRSANALPLRAPVAGVRVSSRFGYRNDPFLHRPALHSGLDFVAAAGTEVQATAPGIIISAGWNGGYGQMVEIRHSGGLSTRYAHLSAVLVQPGARVAAGTTIGRVGSTGRSTGPHLHYETRSGDRAVDPAPYLAAGQAL